MLLYRTMHRGPLLCLSVVVVALAWSGISPRSRFTWLLEILPILIALPILLTTYLRFRLTNPSYVLITIFAVVLCVGGHYTYEHVPLGNWLRDALGLSRNHFDRIGHFLQGVVPALLSREVLLRTSPLRPGGWLRTIVVSISLAISALYELVEWAVAMLAGEAADAFLGMQGDVWDTQKDMALAGLGAIAALLLLTRWQDRQLDTTDCARQSAESGRPTPSAPA